jgi:tetratricopeptide (TPR) repeat protein
MIAARQRWIVIGAALLASGLIALSFFKGSAANSSKTGSRSVDRQSAVSQASTAVQTKWKASQKATFAALTKATDYKPASADQTPCSQEYETLALLSTDELTKRILNQEASLTEACRKLIISEARSMETELDEIRKACQTDINGSRCLTPVIGLKSDLIEAGTKGMDATTLPVNILLSKIYARSAGNKEAADLLETLGLITELESRDENLAFDQLKLSLMSQLAGKDQAYVEEFEAFADKSKADYPEEVMAYRFRNSFVKDDMAKTESILKEHLQHYPNSSQAYYFLAILDYGRGDAQRALALANKSLALDPSNPFLQEQTQKLRDDPKNWQVTYMLPSITFRFGDD